MTLRPAIALALLLPACSSGTPMTSPARPAPIQPTAPPRAAASAPATPATASASAIASAAPPTPEPAPPPIPAPEGALCSLHGSGEPFADTCATNPFMLVSARKDGTSVVARFDPRKIDITWAFFEGPGRAWVGARSGGLRLTGFADAHSELFALGREVTAVERHIWLKEGAPVHVLRGKGRGVEIAVARDMPGVESIPAEVPCDALRFAPPPSPAKEPATRAPASTRTASPKNPTLPIRFEPGGPVRATLRYDKESLPVELYVLEEKGGSSRVAFETEFARFDVWVEARELRHDGGRGIGTMLGNLCGGIPDVADVPWFEVVDDTRVVVAAAPVAGGGPDGLSIERRSVVFVDRRQGGFAEISRPFSAIFPPEGLSFWVPEAALREHPRARSQ